MQNPRKGRTFNQMADMKKVYLYTDGSCRRNPGPGGWGAILRYGKAERELCGGEADTTNNRMELTAVIEGLSDGLSKGWAKSWRAKGWRKSDGSAALNPDLWEKLLGLYDYHKVTIVWVKGHAGHPENERCDEMAQAQSAVYDKE